MRRCKSLPGSPGKVSRGHFYSRTQAGHVPAIAKMRTRNTKAHKLTQNDYRMLHLCINSMQDEKMPGKIEMKAKIHFPPNFSHLRCSSILAGLRHVPLRGWGAHAQPCVQGHRGGKSTAEQSAHHKALVWKKRHHLAALILTLGLSLCLLFPFADSKPFGRTET